MEIICEIELCTGCATCHDVCGHHAIGMEIDANGFFIPIVNQQRCVDCGLCQKVCPVLNPERIRQNKISDVEIYEAWSVNDDIRERSSSGGVFGQLAYDFLQKGWFVAGVVFDGKRASHKIIDHVNDLPLLQNTKYVQSDASLVYADLYKLLKEGRDVIFSGTPCQVAGCYSYLHKKKYTGALLTIEVICHGIPTYLILDKAMEREGATAVKSFRSKAKGWGYDSQRIEYISAHSTFKIRKREEDVFYRYFFCEKFLRPSCYTCPYAHFPRVADMTIGDSWNTDNPVMEERRKGLSLLLLNNSKNNMLSGFTQNIHMREIGWFRQVEINRNLYTPFPPQKGHFCIPRIKNIAETEDLINVESFMLRTNLGIEERAEFQSRFFVYLRMLLQRILLYLQKDGRLEDISPIRMCIILFLKSAIGMILPFASDRFISRKFIATIYHIYKSKHTI